MGTSNIGTLAPSAEAAELPTSQPNMGLRAPTIPLYASLGKFAIRNWILDAHSRTFAQSPVRATILSRSSSLLLLLQE